MDQVMDIVKLNKFNFLKKTDEFRQQSKNVNHENMRIEHAVQILKSPNDVCECNCFIFLEYQ